MWAQVNKVPEFVYFNHSIHINRGLSCNNCHGAVGKMMLTYKAETLHMKWCLDCHRQPEKFLFTSTNGKKKGLTPREQVFDLYLQYQGDKHKLSTREKTLLDGKVDQYVPYASELEDGKKLAEQAGVKRKQLEDCSVCHR